MGGQIAQTESMNTFTCRTLGRFCLPLVELGKRLVEVPGGDNQMLQRVISLFFSLIVLRVQGNVAKFEKLWIRFQSEDTQSIFFRPTPSWLPPGRSSLKIHSQVMKINSMLATMGVQPCVTAKSLF